MHHLEAQLSNLGRLCVGSDNDTRCSLIRYHIDIEASGRSTHKRHRTVVDDIGRAIISRQVEVERDLRLYLTISANRDRGHFIVDVDNEWRIARVALLSLLTLLIDGDGLAVKTLFLRGAVHLPQFQDQRGIRGRIRGRDGNRTTHTDKIGWCGWIAIAIVDAIARERTKDSSLFVHNFLHIARDDIVRHVQRAIRFTRK